MLLVVPTVRAEAEEAAVYTFTINYDVQNTGSYTAHNVKARIFLFDNLMTEWADQQVMSESITVDGRAVSHNNLTIYEEDDNRWAEVSLGNMDSGESKTISVVQTIKVTSVRFSINPSSVGTSISSDLLQYTQPVASLWESDDSSISALATSLTENTTNLYYKARQIFDWVVENLTYEKQTAEHDALWMFQNKKGDCSDFSNLYIALARAAGIPAKAVSGNAYSSLYALTGSQTDINVVGHAWILIYLPDYGWVPADGVWPLGQGSFGDVDYSHIVGATTGGTEVVKSSGVVWPGPGVIREFWSYYTGQSTQVDATSSGNVIPEVMLDVSVQASSQISDGVLPFTVTVKNMSRNQADNVSLTLGLNSTYFEPVDVQSKSSLASNEQWVASFDVTLKDNAYGQSHDIQATATYASEYTGITGQLAAVGSRTVSVAAKPASPVVSQDLMIYVLLGVVAAAVVGVVAVVARR